MNLIISYPLNQGRRNNIKEIKNIFVSITPFDPCEYVRALFSGLAFICMI